MNKPGMPCQLDSILMSDPKSVILERWDTDLRRDALYLVGEIHGDDAVEDGATYRTAPVSWLSTDLGIARTRDAVYILRNRR